MERDFHFVKEVRKALKNAVSRSPDKDEEEEETEEDDEEFYIEPASWQARGDHRIEPPEPKNWEFDPTAGSFEREDNGIALGGGTFEFEAPEMSIEDFEDITLNVNSNLSKGPSRNMVYGDDGKLRFVEDTVETDREPENDEPEREYVCSGCETNAFGHGVKDENGREYCNVTCLNNSINDGK